MTPYASFGESLHCWTRLSINKIGSVVKTNIIDKAEKHKIRKPNEMPTDTLSLLMEIGPA
ncbi:hypothetical protein FW1_contig-03-448 [Bacillus sp. FW1]|nr:hypothetical protein FW1_contig-03-448 [Bacillus sp. FW1]